jgi:hypothetical protein
MDWPMFSISALRTTWSGSQKLDRRRWLWEVNSTYFITCSKLSLKPWVPVLAILIPSQILETIGSEWWCWTNLWKGNYFPKKQNTCSLKPWLMKCSLESNSFWERRDKTRILGTFSLGCCHPALEFFGLHWIRDGASIVGAAEEQKTNPQRELSGILEQLASFA